MPRLLIQMCPVTRKMIPFLIICVFIAGAAGFLFAKAQPQNSSQAVSLEGKWEGTLGSGPNRLRIELVFSKLGDGTLAGQLNSLDQGSELTMFAVRFQSNRVHFEIPDVGGVFDGGVNSAGTDITGTWQQTGGPKQPLNFHRATAVPAQQPPASTPSATAATPPAKPLTVPLDITIPKAPTAFAANGKMHLVYELHVANYGGSDCSLTHLEIISSGSEKSIAAFSAADLEGMTTRPGQPNASPKTKLAAGSIAIIYMWLTLDSAQEVPDALRHKISAKVGAYPDDLTIETIPFAVNRKPVVVLTPPLRGDNWVAANGPSNTSGHRRALIPVDGRSWISQRFAIDWVQLFPDGGTSHGDKADNKNYRAYGQEALAVADGVVTETKDGIPQNVPGVNSRAVPITLETIGGNHVILDLGNGIFAFYAHLQPGSLRVKVGDKVKTGQVLGLVGNSGNSTEPHLHFDICDRSSMLACEGLPYAFPQFDVQGSGWSFKSSESKDAPVTHKMEIPLENQVVRFVVRPQ
ncbi:MAG TPA: M23 family metallopeptidase [Candidatus Acidoferrum sp.]|nr:M23 family metallopeptidase [Candidatus Acidoferrum sp.]